MTSKPETGITLIHGREYRNVALRVNLFRDAHPDWCIKTKIVSIDDDRIVMRTTIKNDEKRTISTGYAEEVRGSSNINRTSALENAETSAVGRALAFFGLAGTEIASADEVANAINQQNSTLFSSKASKTKCWKALRDAASENDAGKARETWDEINSDQQQEVWKELSSGQRSTIKELLKATEEGTSNGKDI